MKIPALGTGGWGGRVASRRVKVGTTSPRHLHPNTALDDTGPVGWRADGETHDWTSAITTMQMGAHPIANQIIEAYLTDSSNAWRIYGYFEAHDAPSGTPIAVFIHHYRQQGMM